MDTVSYDRSLAQRGRTRDGGLNPTRYLLVYFVSKYNNSIKCSPHEHFLILLLTCFYNFEKVYRVLYLQLI